MRSPIASVVPDEYIDASVKQKSQVEGMRVIHHVLVKHSIRIA